MPSAGSRSGFGPLDLACGPSRPIPVARSSPGARQRAASGRGQARSRSDSRRAGCVRAGAPAGAPTGARRAGCARGECPAQAVEPGFNPAGEPLVHRALFLAALDGADQHGRLEAIRANTLLGFDAVALGVLVAGLRNGPRPLPQLTLGRPDEIAPPRKFSLFARTGHSGDQARLSNH